MHLWEPSPIKFRYWAAVGAFVSAVVATLPVLLHWKPAPPRHLNGHIAFDVAYAGIAVTMSHLAENWRDAQSQNYYSCLLPAHIFHFCF